MARLRGVGLNLALGGGDLRLLDVLPGPVLPFLERFLMVPSGEEAINVNGSSVCGVPRGW